MCDLRITLSYKLREDEFFQEVDVVITNYPTNICIPFQYSVLKVKLMKLSALLRKFVSQVWEIDSFITQILQEKI